MSKTKVNIMDIDISDRKKICSNISATFGGRVPADVNEFNKVIDDTEANRLLKSIIDWYEEIGFELTYTTHDLFIIYGNVMR